MAMFKSSWGTVELWISKITTNEGRDLVIQKYARGNVPDVQNRGDTVRFARCQLLFDDITRQKEDGESRLQSLIEIKGRGKPQLFTHPLAGTYLAEIQEFDYDIDESGTITGSATFVATEEVGAVVVDPVGQSVDVDGSALSAAIDSLKLELENVELPTDIIDKANEVAAIFDEANSARDVLVGLSDITERIGQQINDLELAADVELWPLMKAFVIAGEAARLAAVAATGDVGDLMTVRVDQEITLWRLVTDIYGAADAPGRRDEALELNDIATPGRLSIGTQLKLRQPKRAA